jgi:protein TonB
MSLYRIGLVIIVSCLHIFALLYLAQTGASSHLEQPIDISVQLLPLAANQSASPPIKQMAVPQSKPILAPTSPSLPARSSPTFTEQQSQDVAQHTTSAEPPANTAPSNAAPSTTSQVESSAYQEPRSAAYLNNPKPEYPPVSRRLQETGKVLLRVHVDTSGVATDVEIRNSSGFARLDSAAVKAVWQWRFIPAKRGETAVAAWVLIPLKFELNS